MSARPAPAHPERFQPLPPRQGLLKTPGQPDLEWLSLSAEDAGATVKRAPMIMIHGANLDAWCWTRTWMSWFAQRGHDVHAISLRGHDRRHDAVQSIDSFGLSDYETDVLRLLDELATPVIAVGNSMGGLVLQRLMHSGRIRPHEAGSGDANSPTVSRRDRKRGRRDDGMPRVIGVSLVDSVPPTGLLGSATTMSIRRPRQMQELVSLAMSGKVSGRLLGALAEDPLPATEIVDVFSHVRRESARALWEMSWAPMGWNPLLMGFGHVGHHPPVQVMHGVADKLLPVSTASVTATHWQTSAELLPNTGHLPMIEKHWLESATRLANWIDALPIAASAAH